MSSVVAAFLFLLAHSVVANPYHAGRGPGGGQFTSKALEGTGFGAGETPSGSRIVKRDYESIKNVILSKSGSRDEAKANFKILNFALHADKMGYARGLDTIDFRSGDWYFNAAYTSVGDKVMISDKFHRMNQALQVRSILHELGHRGTYTSGKADFAEFERQNLGEFFPKLVSSDVLGMYQKSEWNQEAFANSYASHVLGYRSPVPEIQSFWSGVSSRGASDGVTVGTGAAAVGQ